MNSSMILLSILSIIIYYFITQYLIRFLKRKDILLDKNFIKPQSYHSSKTPLIGGISIYLPLLFMSFFLQHIINAELILIVSFFFIIGIIEDIFENINPYFRLIIMIVGALFLFTILDFRITKIELNFFDALLTNYYFSIFFTTACFIIIINGSNFIDGYNGLLSLHSLIIIAFMLVISNYFYGVKNFYQIIIFVLILHFLFHNFPKAKAFLGDSGAYIIGALISYMSIKFFQQIDVSPFFICIILFFISFETIFSFIRKIVLKKSPFLPDKNHLHMLIYFKVLESTNDKKKSNYLASILYNLITIILIFPSFFYLNNNFLSCVHLIILFISYFVIYFSLFENLKKG